MPWLFLLARWVNRQNFMGVEKNFWQNAEEWPQPVAVLGLRSRFDPRISIA